MLLFENNKFALWNVEKDYNQCWSLNVFIILRIVTTGKSKTISCISCFLSHLQSTVPCSRTHKIQKCLNRHFSAAYTLKAWTPQWYNRNTDYNVLLFIFLHTFQSCSGYMCTLCTMCWRCWVRIPNIFTFITPTTHSCVKVTDMSLTGFISHM